MQTNCLALAIYARSFSVIYHSHFSAVTLSGTVQFRGLLVQARSMADDSPVGSFTAESGVTRLSSCARSDVCFCMYTTVLHVCTS